MKATGLCRRIDNLGRIVIPKEIRRSLRIREGEPMEIIVNKEGEILLSKFSPVQDLGQMAEEYVEVLAESTRALACVCDRQGIVAAAGPESSKWVEQPIHPELLDCIEQRQSVVATVDDARFCKLMQDAPMIVSEVICPIVVEGDALGAVFIAGKNKNRIFSEIEENVVSCGAKFLGKQFEV